MKVRKLIILLSLTVIMAGCGSKKKEIDPDAQNVIEEIDKIGDVDLDDEYTIERAREKYDKLDKNVKKQVSNYKVLLDAEDELDVLQKDLEDNTIHITIGNDSSSVNVKSNDSKSDYEKGDYTISNINDSWDLNEFGPNNDADIHIYNLSYDVLPGRVPEIKLYYSAEVIQKNQHAVETKDDVSLSLDFNFRDKDGNLIFDTYEHKHVKIDENGYGYIDTFISIPLFDVPEGEYKVEVLTHSF